MEIEAVVLARSWTSQEMLEEITRLRTVAREINGDLLEERRKAAYFCSRGSESLAEWEYLKNDTKIIEGVGV